ncbi:MAG: T9SS type A sorting domain-containing protein [Bacteroidetes bacterium]|jgi:hypothetical protein|nr:T9SS type A sorting domain-containing protein [Bacteroidota bacterium]MBT3750116.1 T9SS type A sorting domain-containing protein [Bacteroidota bacterium]MBT4400187.1 T9SS type A sorting domain-containing protein [Bacteroidota bacterium]MBT4410087.1 T9SS type A sorting domain-containing protein [Bacteroidota bacterium]MBT5425394.1 T9SS type A sorting domain-containing protein [Bacteroidota bacterium]
MNRHLIAWLINILIGSTICTAQSLEYLQVGGTANDHGYSMISDISGNVFITGSTRSYGQGSEDIFLVKMNKFEELEFQKTYGSTHHDIARSIDLAADGGYVIFGEAWDHGHGREDMYLLKVDQDGNTLWEQSFGGNHTDQGHSVEALPDGYACLGYTASYGGSTRGNFLLTRTDLSGNILWEKDYGTEFLDYGFSVKQIWDGGLALLGNKGGFFNLARADFTNHDSDVLLVLTLPDGEEEKRISWGGSGHDWGKDMVLTDESILVVGSSQQEETQSFDIFLAEISQEGSLTRESYYGGNGFEFGEALCRSTDGMIYIAGTSSSLSSDGSTDIYIAKTMLNGDLIWEQRLGGTGSDYGFDILPMPDSGCLVLGEIEDPILHTQDLYLARLNKNGELMSLGKPKDLEPIIIKIYPNPASDYIRVKWLNQLDSSSSILQIFNLSGQIVHHEEIPGQEETFISLPDLSPQTLIYQVISKDARFTGKLVIQ